MKAHPSPKSANTAPARPKRRRELLREYFANALTLAVLAESQTGPRSSRRERFETWANSFESRKFAT